MKIKDDTLSILVENLSLKDYISVTKDISELETEIDKLKNIISEAVKLTTNLLNTEKQGYYQIIFKEQLKVLNGDKNVN